MRWQRIWTKCQNFGTTVIKKALTQPSRFLVKACPERCVRTRTRNGLFLEIPKITSTTMKKQIDPPTKAHLHWSALILLSLLAIGAIPFALAQSILYDQLNNAGSQSTNSQSFFNDQAADDFVVPVGQTWAIREVDVQGVYFNCSSQCGPADSFNFNIYQDFGGLPGLIVAGGGLPYVNNSGLFQLVVGAQFPIFLNAGRYWVSVQANMSSTNGMWGWTDRTVQANSPAVWQNPGGQFNSCLTWGVRTTCVGDAPAPDQMFRLVGTIGGGTPTPTPTGTPSPTPSGTPSPTPTGTPSPTPTGTPSPTPTGTPSPSATAACSRPTPGTCVSYEAESDANTLTGSAFVLSCPTCSGGEKVGFVGNNSGTLQFNAIGIVVPGRHSVTISYTNGDAVRYALLSVNGNQGFPLTFPSTGSFQTVGSIQTTVVLNTGCNTLEFYNPIVGSWAPDFDRISMNCSTACSLLQQQLNRLQRRQQQLQQRHLSNRTLNKRIRQVRRQLQDQGCL
jgi:hypothetical protein